MVFLLAQFLLGGVLASIGRQKQVQRLHRMFGLVAYVTTTMVILLGIQEQEDFAGCSYHDDSQGIAAMSPRSLIDMDNNDDNHTKYSCVQSEFLSFLLFVMALCTCLALYDDSYDDNGVNDDNYRSTTSNRLPVEGEANDGNDGIPDFGYQLLDGEEVV